MDALEKARLTINQIDDEMAELFVRRMEACASVAQYKKEHGLPIFNAAREEEVIRRGEARVENDLLRGYYVNFQRGCMELSKQYQHFLLQGMRVAYSGTEGAFGHIAACKLFPTAEQVAYGDFAAAYRAVVQGECDTAVLPIENSYNGEVGQVIDLMFSGSLYVNAVLDLAVTQDLLVIPGTKRDEIKTVLSHPQALGQCAGYIRKMGWETREFGNTALAARQVAQAGDRSVAAIASADAARVFGLEVMERNINESRNNTTRFAVFSRADAKRTNGRMGEHFILVFTVKNEAGSLARAIDVIGQHGFNMRNLRSRPMKELLWQYYFYVEADGNVHGEEGKRMLEDLSSFCDRLKVVGTYMIEGEPS